MKILNWIYKDKEIVSIDQLPSNAYGFIYLLIFIDPNSVEKAYIGQKALYSYRTLPALKNGSQRSNSERIGKNIKGKRQYFDVVKKESNWKAYKSSSKDIPKNAELVERHILDIATSKRHLTYLETKYLFLHEVLESDDYYNKNILGKFYEGNLK